MKNSHQSEIHQLMEQWAQAVAARDLDRVMSFYASGQEFVGFDFVPPFIFSGAEAFRGEWEKTFRLFDKDPTFELRDVRVYCEEDLAFAYGLSHFVGIMQQKSIDIWTRQTNAFRRINGTWLMIHEHVSVPVDMQSMKGIIDFKP